MADDAPEGPKVFEFRRSGKPTQAEERHAFALKVERERFETARLELPRIRFWSWVTGAAVGLFVAVPGWSLLPWGDRFVLAVLLVLLMFVAAGMTSRCVRRGGLADG